MKKRIIIFSILGATLILIGVLFGVVFALRNQNVTFVNENIKITKEEIVSTANLKHGTPIFAINKDEAIKNIEDKYPNLKVVHVKTNSVTEIEFIIDLRQETFYTIIDDSAFILDKDLKVLAKESKDETEKYQHLISLSNKIASVSKDSKVCDFVGGAYSQIITNMYDAIFDYATKITDKTYLSHQEILQLVKSVKLDKAATLSGECDVLVIQLNEETEFGNFGETIEIWKPESDLAFKFNACYSTLLELEKENIQPVKITYGYDENDVDKLTYSLKK